ncbi:MAG: hypothetical protein B6D56_06250 [Candidatus Omnitrophica bacterium 4484_70.1]|nr:MAG: hypothetical protein B6D56_06250 [Candidatus Omnitrophica bacterium 4484_70.1]
MNIWVVIPAYNEEKNIGELVNRLKRKNLSVLVIDDGSEDNTFGEAKRSGAEVIRNERNLGKGLSLKKGIRYLLEKEKFDYIITMDADRQHSPDDTNSFIKEAEEGKFFVVGDRMLKPCNMPKIRVFTNKIMSWLISKIIRQNINDTQCGFRLIKKDVLEKINIETSKFEIESEILIKTRQLGFPIKSIPIRSIYFKESKSKIRPFRDTLRFIKFLIKIIRAKERI